MKQQLIPGNHQSTYCLYEFDYFNYFISGIIQYLSICDWLTSLSLMLSRFIHAEALYILLCVYTTFVYSFIRSLDIRVASTSGYCITLKMFLSGLFLSKCICSIYLLSLLLICKVLPYSSYILTLCILNTIFSIC